MMASINPNKTPVKLTMRLCSFFFVLNDSPLCRFSHIQDWFGSISERQATGIRGQQDNENMSLERSLMSGGRRNCYPLHHYLVQQRDVLQHTHTQMSVSAAPAGKVQVAKKVSPDPEGDSPDKGAERCW